ncbi:hypothetical protein OW774_13625 [Klebsiella pneumoniae]|uniref:hypothetical protein n=1 Tax=Klebsiella pneumoniae TaxID=573 RepID=UPI001E60DCC6|nr:hypothetical protein [Klebsiella pneumoniae]MCC4936779.1 hypothetical protein [Klebsiella pneumoniae]MDP0903939.1 hypothetical protein [Klebsiella pneumoniae]
MTNITELAQSLKRRAASANEFGESLYVKADDVIALVEALEKAQQVDEELCRLLPPGVEYMDPPDGGDVTPLEGVRRMVADYRQRIAQLESRTVRLPEPFELAISSSGLRYYYADEVDAAIIAAGIKVEAK